MFVNRPTSLVDLFFFSHASRPDFVPNGTTDDSVERVFTTATAFEFSLGGGRRRFIVATDRKLSRFHDSQERR